MTAADVQKMSDHDMLVTLVAEVRTLRETIQELADGKTANCAKERARVDALEADVKRIRENIGTIHTRMWLLLSGVALLILGGVITFIMNGGPKP